MIDQTLALFLDAYRELNAKKMFWIVLVLSGVIVVAFACVGIKDDHVSFLWMQSPIPALMGKEEFYKGLFSAFGVSVWLAFAATILALISTASIFPDFITGGSIDLYLSKPIGRLRLFATKYVTGLLFVALQVLIFATACFFVIGVRGGAWEPGLFLAVPLVVCFFSYLYAASVLVGIVTRSTIAAVLLTVLLWFVLFCVDRGEVGLLFFKNVAEREQASTERRVTFLDGRLAYFAKQSPEQQAASKNLIDSFRQQRDELVASRDGNQRSLRNIVLGHRVIYAVKTALPKTRETTEIMNRKLVRPMRAEVPEEAEDEAATPEPRRRRRGISPADAQKLDETLRARSLWWIIGTSLTFEAVVLALAAWIFCRRDY